jgi:hypothetical protein
MLLQKFGVHRNIKELMWPWSSQIEIQRLRYDPKWELPTMIKRFSRPFNVMVVHMMCKYYSNDLIISEGTHVFNYMLNFCKDPITVKVKQICNKEKAHLLNATKLQFISQNIAYHSEWDHEVLASARDRCSSCCGCSGGCCCTSSIKTALAVDLPN